MERTLIFNDTFNTASDGWLLEALTLTEAEPQTDFVEVPGRDGAIDLSEQLGNIRYSNRTLDAQLMLDSGLINERMAKTSKITEMHGKRVKVVHPDFPGYYLQGRLTVTARKNYAAFVTVKIQVLCDPFLYADTVTTGHHSSTSSSTTNYSSSLTSTTASRAELIVKVNLSSVSVSREQWVSIADTKYTLPAGKSYSLKWTIDLPATLKTSTTTGVDYEMRGLIL